MTAQFPFPRLQKYPHMLRLQLVAVDGNMLGARDTQTKKPTIRWAFE